MTEQKQRNVDSQRRFRATHRRIDYAPRPAIWAIIEEHLQGAPVKSLTRVIDRLILAGHEAITGNLSERDVPVDRTEQVSEIQYRRLTPRQEAFACAVATGPNQSLTESYRQVYAPQNAKPETVNKMAARLAALPHLAARIGDLRGGVVAAVMKSAGHTREDAIYDLGILAEDAMGRGQIGAAVRATTLRARLAGFLPSSRKSHGRKNASGRLLTEADTEALLKLRDEMEAKLKRDKEAADQVGEAPTAASAVAVPIREEIE